MKKIITFIFFLHFFMYHCLYADESYNKGKEIFIGEGNCSTCHSLSDVGSNAQIGPNLNDIKPDIMRVMMAVKNGIGVMPAYEGQLSSLEIEAVAKYVYEASNE